MPRSIGFYAYPWSLHEPRRDLETMQALGLTHITVATSYHAGKFIQPRDRAARVYFPEDGTVYFAARPERYGALRPRIAALTQERDVLHALCEADVMPVRAWTVLNHNSRLGWEHPEASVANAWGDRYPYSLCPANPDVRAYDIALCADLAAAYPIESLLLESPGWLVYNHGYHHEFAQHPGNANLDALMGLCFCDHCIGGAAASGVDAEALRRSVRAAADDALNTMRGEARLDPATTDALAGYHRWRATVVATLCAEIRAAVRAQVQVRIISTCQRPHATCYLEGVDLAALDRVTDGLELPIYQPSTDDALADLADVVSRVGSAKRLSVILRPGYPDMTGEQQLRDTVARVVAAGIEDVSFYNFGMLPAEQIGWVERALADMRQGLANA